MNFLQEGLKEISFHAKAIDGIATILQGYANGSDFEPQTTINTLSGISPEQETPSTGQTDGNLRGSYTPPEKASKWTVLPLTEKEVLKMPKKFRKTFRTGKTVAHVRQKPNGVYEIRCQIDKVRIEASSKYLEEAKSKFIEKLKERTVTIIDTTEKTIQLNNDSVATKAKTEVVTQEVTPVATNKVTLGEYMLKWLKTVKKPNVKENSYRLYVNSYYKANIRPVLGDRPVNEIKPFELQEFLNELVSEGKAATARQCRKLLVSMYDYAVIDDMVTKSPMLKVTLPHHEAKQGVPLSREEEKQLSNTLKNGGDIYVQAYVFILYTGLRRSELASIEVKDGWVNLVSAKGRKGYKVRLRSVPISPMLAPLLPLIDIDGIKKLSLKGLTENIKAMFPSHHTHELRHTFITRCQECGIRRELVSLWAGHTADNSITTTVYTHLEHNKDIQIEEIKKFKYKL